MKTDGRERKKMKRRKDEGLREGGEGRRKDDEADDAQSLSHTRDCTMPYTAARALALLSMPCFTHSIGLFYILLSLPRR